MAFSAMVSLPNYGKPFDVHTDASNKQIRACVSQEGKSITFISRKFNIAQQKYPVGEKELLSIAETLKVFKTMLKGQRVTV